MNINRMLKQMEKFTRRNSSSIFAGIGVAGVAATAYLTAKATFQASDLIREVEEVEGTADDKKERIKERTKLVWPLYVPPAVAATASIGCIIASTRAGSKRVAAATTAYTLTERAFSEYRDKVVEQIGERKEQGVRDAIAQDTVTRNPPSQAKVIITGSGEVLCREMYTGRYFKCDMESLRKAQNDINSRIMNELYVTLDEFYNLIGLPGTTLSGQHGWDSDRLLELEFSTALSEDGDPCLTFEYNYLKIL